jgi:anaerobic magnesium-protoporphyrin IX monomethyl ester cyclase
MKAWICTTLASFFGPMQGAARLFAYTKKNGYDVALKDLNQDAYFWLLSRANLEQLCQTLSYSIDSTSRNRYYREDIGGILAFNSNNRIIELIKNLSGKEPLHKDVFYSLLEAQDCILAEVEKSRQILDKQFLSLQPDEFLSNYRTLLIGKAIIDAVYYPAMLDMGLGFYGNAYSTSANDIIRATTDTRFNFILPYFQQVVIPSLQKEQPEVVGISVTHTSEFIPAFTLARVVKTFNPQIHVCLGGSTVTEVGYRISKNPQLWEYFDSLVLGPGENAFSKLIESLSVGKDLAGVPNLIYKTKGNIIKSSIEQEFDINEACTPEYVSVRPKTPLPLETASGCYWGKCIFCYYPRQGTADIATGYNKKRVRNIELVLKDIEKLRDTYNPAYIGITDSSLHPDRIEQIVDFNNSNNKKVTFAAFIRLEKEFKSPAFCKKIAEGGFLGGQAGLESGSQRINDIINKGVNLSDAEFIIRNIHEAGMLTHLYTLIGTPGETALDASKTRDFINRLQPVLALGWQIYSLYVVENGPLNERAEEFGLKVFPLPDEYLSQFTIYSTQSGLSQDESITLALKYSEELRSLIHPLHNIMDVESHKVFLLTQKANGIAPKLISEML